MRTRVGLALATALALALLVASSTYGQATTERFDIEFPFSGTTALPECLPEDLVGTLTGTNRQVGHVAETDRGFHVHGTETESYTVVFPDGSYVEGVATGHFKFNVTFRSGTTSVTTVIQEPRTIFDANDEPIGKVFIHAVSHITYRDVNGNGEPDEGELRANVDRFFFTCK
jgi:hypothetical protein